MVLDYVSQCKILFSNIFDYLKSMILRFRNWFFEVKSNKIDELNLKSEMTIEPSNNKNEEEEIKKNKLQTTFIFNVDSNSDIDNEIPIDNMKPHTVQEIVSESENHSDDKKNDFSELNRVISEEYSQKSNIYEYESSDDDDLVYSLSSNQAVTTNLYQSISNRDSEISEQGFNDENEFIPQSDMENNNEKIPDTELINSEKKTDNFEAKMSRNLVSDSNSENDINNFFGNFEKRNSDKMINQIFYEKNDDCSYKNNQETYKCEDQNADMNSSETKIINFQEAMQYKNQGNEYYFKNMFVEAEKQYAIAIHHLSLDYPNDLAILHSNLSCVQYELGKFEEALKNADSSIEFNPDYPKGYLRRYKVNFQLEKIHKALEDLKKACDLDRNLVSKYSTTLSFLQKESDKLLEIEKAEMVEKLKTFGNWALGKVGLSLDNFEMIKNQDNGSYNIQYKQAT